MPNDSSTNLVWRTNNKPDFLLLLISRVERLLSLRANFRKGHEVLIGQTRKLPFAKIWRQLAGIQPLLTDLALQANGR